MVVCTGGMTRVGEPVPFDRSVAEDSLLEAPTRLVTPRGLPAHELSRSPCAARVGALAAEAGLFGFHYEHRVRLPWPEAWGEREAVGWSDGRLPEPKYAAFSTRYVVAQALQFVYQDHNKLSLIPRLPRL